MATIITTKNNKQIVLLNPSEKAEKYARELKGKFKCTNDGKLKLSENGKGIELSDVERSYRSGYLQARQDGAKAYKYNKKKGKK